MTCPTRPEPPLNSLAIISNAPTPYRTAFQTRLTLELQGVSVACIYTHDISNAPWKYDEQGIVAIYPFGRGENSADAPKPAFAMREWKKGGRIIRWLKEHQIRHVLVEGYNDVGRLRIIRWCHANRVPCFVWGDSNIRGDFARGFKRIIKSAYIRQLDRWCQAFLVCGSLGRDFFMAYGVDPKKIFYMPYEPDYAKIDTLGDDAITAAKQTFGLAEHRRRLLFCGRLVEEKDPVLLLETFIQIANVRPNWDLVFAGDGRLRATLERMIPEGLQSRVIFTGFQERPAMVIAVMKSCDILVLPSKYEPWAAVVNEAVAAGLALVCSNAVGAAVELVRDGINGFIFRAGDRQSLNNAVLAATQSDAIDRLKSGSKHMLQEWREKADPVVGVRDALRSCRGS